MTYPYAFSTSRSIAGRCLAAALASLLAFGSSALLAQDTAKLNVTGTITGSTCSLSVSSATLDIGTVQQSVFMAGVGSASPFSNVGTIATDPNCTASMVSMTFTADADPNDSNLFAVTGGAAGVGIKLEGMNSSGDWQQAIPNSTTSPITRPIGVQSFRASYIRTAAPLVNGTADASITVLVTYT